MRIYPTLPGFFQTLAEGFANPKPWIKLPRALSQALFLGLLCTTALAWAQGPKELISQTAGLMIEELRSNQKKIQDDSQYVNRLVERNLLPIVDLAYMSRLTLAKNWKKLSNEQKTDFMDSYKRLLTRTYAGAFSSFTDQKLQFTGEKFSKKGDKVLIKSEIIQSSGAPIQVDYKMRLKDNQWFVYDAIIEGVSLVKSYRTQFNEQIAREGIDAMIINMNPPLGKTAQK